MLTGQISRKTIPYRTGRYGQYFPYRYLGRYKNVAIPEPFRLYRRKIRISAGKEKKRKKIKTLSSLATTDPVTDTTPISEFSAFSSRPHVATTTAQSSSSSSPSSSLPFFTFLFIILSLVFTRPYPREQISFLLLIGTLFKGLTLVWPVKI